MRLYLKTFQALPGHDAVNFEAHDRDNAGADTVKTTRITVETERTLIVRRAEHLVGWCPFCNREGEYILLDNAALVELTVGVRIQELREAGRLHLWQQEDGLTRVCLASLLCCFELDGNSGIQIAKEAI